MGVRSFAWGNFTALWLQVDVLVTTAGGVEEDFIKCLAPTYLGSAVILEPKKIKSDTVCIFSPIYLP